MTDFTVTENGAQPILVCDHLVKRYTRDPIAPPALDGISLEIPAGKIVGLLGPNGSGKTTLIKIAAGLLRETSGSVRIDGKPIGPETKAVVAYLPERNSVPETFTIAEAMRLYHDFFADFDVAKARDMLARLGVQDSMRIKELSKGTKEKVQLVLVMARRAKLYLLDEPISGVDPAARDFILETILTGAREGSTILISTHLISDIEKVMNSFVFLKYGHICHVGTPEELMASTGKTVDEYFREVFRC